VGIIKPMNLDLFRQFPCLETDRLILRELKPGDMEAVFRYFSDPEVTRYLNAGPYKRVEQAGEMIDFLRSMFQNRTGFRWGITLKKEGGDRVIGTCGYHAWVNSQFRAEMGYELAREYWGQGIMREAIQELLTFGFTQMALNRVDAHVLPGNRASARFLEKLGFEQESFLREYESVHGKFQDILLFFLLKEDYLLAEE
jgi:[ribosomal protein S5]-alanine N-acetyltransferase